MDTIAAIATARAPGAIGIIRLSGPDAIAVAEAVFTPRGGIKLHMCTPRRLVLGALHDKGGAVIDEALATISHAPHSYTGEDTAELQCHGSPTVLALALEALFARGARQAAAGEFTKRAFLNGRMDLTQAEAVVDLIDAETPAAARQAAGQLSGALRRRVDEIYSTLTDLMAHFFAVLDYPDEDIDPFSAQGIADTLQAATSGLRNLLASYERGRFLSQGVPCAIVGRPNVGKSSLLNALLGYERAIVTDIPGTTRDTVEERCTLGGVLLRLIDTAGLRHADDLVEQMGVARSQKALAQAELALFVVDGGLPLTPEDRAVMALARKAPRAICVVNKSDLSPRTELEELQAAFLHTVTLSAATGTGLNQLEEAVAALFPTPEQQDSELLTNARQFDAAQRALQALTRAEEALARGMTPDALLTDVEEGMSALGELTGRTIRDDITSRIFERFCVGK
ncbi:MAG: tRNA uridine-5-carboxymethylaminomethyl(34) synthesis GTPase MnmE [Oscillospiraceae bacterium]|nr:tRNA uridine-5-carboxymethylaminomethyl(34) synthesis GTPase MnmE [Oscillospiraceae bacterium]